MANLQCAGNIDKSYCARWIKNKTINPNEIIYGAILEIRNETIPIKEYSIRRLLPALVIVPLLAVTGARANLLTNGNFATGSLTNWTAGGAVSVLLESDYGLCCGAHNTTPGAYMLDLWGR